MSPTSTITYTVIVTNENGCQATDQVTVFVDPVQASAGADETICEGEIVTLTASSGASYLWNNGSIAQSITVNPTTTTTYTVTVTNEAGCQATDQVTVFVDSAIANAGPCLLYTSDAADDQ